eukprot:jgi/Mesvir1/26893/Mv20623-RA.3
MPSMTRPMPSGSTFIFNIFQSLEELENSLSGWWDAGAAAEPSFSEFVTANLAVLKTWKGAENVRQAASKLCQLITSLLQQCNDLVSSERELDLAEKNSLRASLFFLCEAVRAFSSRTSDLVAGGKCAETVRLEKKRALKQLLTTVSQALHFFPCLLEFLDTWESPEDTASAFFIMRRAGLDCVFCAFAEKKDAEIAPLVAKFDANIQAIMSWCFVSAAARVDWQRETLDMLLALCASQKLPPHFLAAVALCTISEDEETGFCGVVKFLCTQALAENPEDKDNNSDRAEACLQVLVTVAESTSPVLMARLHLGSLLPLLSHKKPAIRKLVCQLVALPLLLPSLTRDTKRPTSRAVPGQPSGPDQLSPTEPEQAWCLRTLAVMLRDRDANVRVKVLDSWASSPLVLELMVRGLQRSCTVMEAMRSGTTGSPNQDHAHGRDDGDGADGGNETSDIDKEGVPDADGVHGDGATAGAYNPAVAAAGECAALVQELALLDSKSVRLKAAKLLISLLVAAAGGAPRTESGHSEDGRKNDRGNPGVVERLLSTLVRIAVVPPGVPGHCPQVLAAITTALLSPELRGALRLHLLVSALTRAPSTYPLLQQLLLAHATSLAQWERLLVGCEESSPGSLDRLVQFLAAVPDGAAAGVPKKAQSGGGSNIPSGGHGLAVASVSAGSAPAAPARFGDAFGGLGVVEAAFAQLRQWSLRDSRKEGGRADGKQRAGMSSESDMPADKHRASGDRQQTGRGSRPLEMATPDCSTALPAEEPLAELDGPTGFLLVIQVLAPYEVLGRAPARGKKNGDLTPARHEERAAKDARDKKKALATCMHHDHELMLPAGTSGVTAITAPRCRRCPGDRFVLANARALHEQLTGVHVLACVLACSGTRPERAMRRIMRDYEAEIFLPREWTPGPSTECCGDGKCVDASNNYNSDSKKGASGPDCAEGDMPLFTDAGGNIAAATDDRAIADGRDPATEGVAGAGAPATADTGVGAAAPAVSASSPLPAMPAVSDPSTSAVSDPSNAPAGASSLPVAGASGSALQTLVPPSLASPPLASGTLNEYLFLLAEASPLFYRRATRLLLAQLSARVAAGADDGCHVGVMAANGDDGGNVARGGTAGGFDYMDQACRTSREEEAKLQISRLIASGEAFPGGYVPFLKDLFMLASADTTTRLAAFAAFCSILELSPPLATAHLDLLFSLVTNEGGAALPTTPASPSGDAACDSAGATSGMAVGNAAGGVGDTGQKTDMGRGSPDVDNRAREAERVGTSGDTDIQAATRIAKKAEADGLAINHTKAAMGRPDGAIVQVAATGSLRLAALDAITRLVGIAPNEFIPRLESLAPYLLAHAWPPLREQSFRAFCRLLWEQRLKTDCGPLLGRVAVGLTDPPGRVEPMARFLFGHLCGPHARDRLKVLLDVYKNIPPDASRGIVDVLVGQFLSSRDLRAEELVRAVVALLVSSGSSGTADLVQDSCSDHPHGPSSKGGVRRDKASAGHVSTRDKGQGRDVKCGAVRRSDGQQQRFYSAAYFASHLVPSAAVLSSLGQLAQDEAKCAKVGCMWLLAPAAGPGDVAALGDLVTFVRNHRKLANSNGALVAPLVQRLQELQAAYNPGAATTRESHKRKSRLGGVGPASHVRQGGGMEGEDAWFDPAVAEDYAETLSRFLGSHEIVSIRDVMELH